MTRKRKPDGGKASLRKLKVKKETLKDLDGKGKASKVKGGDMVEYASALVPCAPLTTACPTHTCGPSKCVVCQIR